MRLQYILALTAFSAGLAAAAPVIKAGGILNSASYSPLGPPGTGIAQGSIFVVFGSDMGPAALAQAPSLPLAASLAGTSVTITPASGAPVQAFMVYTSSGQLAAILPSTTPAGDANVTVTYNGSTSAPMKIQVVRSNFGIYTKNSAGAGPAVVQNFVAEGNTPVNGFTEAAAPGQTLILYGTGLGPISVPDNAAPGLQDLGSGVEVQVGGVTVKPFYAGRSPNFPGLDQINFTLPSDDSVPNGCYVTVAVKTGSVLSNVATIAKARGKKTCDSGYGLTEDMLRRLDTPGGSLNLGVLTLGKTSTQAALPGVPVVVNVTSENASAVFTRIDSNSLYLATTSGSIPPVLESQGCVLSTLASAAGSAPSLPSLTAPVPLNAGDKLTLTGPGVTKDMPRQTTGFYSAELSRNIGSAAPDVLKAGTWKIDGPGGTDVGQFSAQLNIPDPLTCTSCAGLTTINRNQDLALQFTGGGSGTYTIVAGSSGTLSPSDPNQMVSVQFACRVPPGATSFTVPADILRQLPATGQNSFGAILVINGTQVGTGGQGTFTAPLRAGGNLDLGVFAYTGTSIRTVTYQ